MFKIGILSICLFVVLSCSRDDDLRYSPDMAAIRELSSICKHKSLPGFDLTERFGTPPEKVETSLLMDKGGTAVLFKPLGRPRVILFCSSKQDFSRPFTCLAASESDKGFLAFHAFKVQLTDDNINSPIKIVYHAALADVPLDIHVVPNK